jgi:hypothetical protein
MFGLYSVYDMRGTFGPNDRRVKGGEPLRTTGAVAYVYTETGSEYDAKLAATPGIRKIGEFEGTPHKIEEWTLTCDEPAPAWYVAGTRHQPTQRCPFLPPRMRR